MPLYLASAACCRGVWPLESSNWQLAPWINKFKTISLFPLATAKCNGVLPDWSTLSSKVNFNFCFEMSCSNNCITLSRKLPLTVWEMAIRWNKFRPVSKSLERSKSIPSKLSLASSVKTWILPRLAAWRSAFRPLKKFETVHGLEPPFNK